MFLKYSPSLQEAGIGENLIAELVAFKAAAAQGRSGAAAYMALALDKALSENDYAKELKTLHGDWPRFLTIRDSCATTITATCGRPINPWPAPLAAF